MLPLSLDMDELNSNEKFTDLSIDLPAVATKPGTIQNGDLMLFGSRTLVLFYKSFRTPYTYTHIGFVDKSSGLDSSLGSGRVQVTSEMA